VVLLTSGPIRVGWAAQDTNLLTTKVGDDRFSIGFDGYWREIYYNKIKSKCVASIPRWKAGDVIGCLLEANKENNCRFYLNGQDVHQEVYISILPQPYHAAVSLAPHQQVLFNFGQEPFIHPPVGVKFISFYIQPIKKEVDETNYLQSVEKTSYEDETKIGTSDQQHQTNININIKKRPIEDLNGNHLHS